MPLSAFYLSEASTGLIRSRFAKKVETLARTLEKLRACSKSGVEGAGRAGQGPSFARLIISGR